MTQIENAFDLLFKARGGKYQGKFSESDLFSHVLKNSRDLIEKMRRKNPELPDVYIDIIDNTTLNACATKSGQKYFIGIHAGTIFLIHDIFFRMMSSRNIFTDIGDITKEGETKKIFNAQLTDLGQLAVVKGQQEILAPVSYVRGLLAQIFIDIAIEFLIAHEYAHIIFGHVDYCHSLLGTFEIEEATQKAASGNSIDPLISQTLEMDADSFATNRGMEILNLLFNNPDFVVPDAQQFYKDWPSMIKMWVFSIYTFFRIFAHSNNSTFIKTDLHPPPSIRATLIMANIYSIFQIKYDTSILGEISKICIDAAFVVEKAFEEISEQGLDLASFNFSTKDEAFIHGQFLMKNWNTVRPLLVPFTHSPLAPLHVDEV
jgi:hypothetical protein